MVGGSLQILVAEYPGFLSSSGSTTPPHGGYQAWLRQSMYQSGRHYGLGASPRGLILFLALILAPCSLETGSMDDLY
jgi:hypothetical protein